MSAQEPIDDRSIEIRTYFVRGRNALVARGEFSQLYVDYYLHLADYAQTVDPDAAEYAKLALAGIALHCASRPRRDRVAWTVNFQDPLLNVFAAGDNVEGTVVSTVYTEGVRKADRGMFYADTIPAGGEPRRSVVDFEGGDFFAAAERFYAHSEQRPGRFFRHSDDDFVLVGAQPDCDVEWLEGLTAESIRGLDEREELSLLEQRYFRFECGCNQDRMMRAVAPAFLADADDLFGDEPLIRMGCPRCGAKHVITREALEAFAAGAA
ncbi:MAG: Hsp33 family molecular chaperone HslO [Chthoniobacterales bacterium]